MQVSAAALDYVAGAECFAQPAFAAEHLDAEVAECAGAARHFGSGVTVNLAASAECFAQPAFAAEPGVTAATEIAFLPARLRISLWH